jgi:enamine deaminase RidA (YjgF/YER057c/UK114 family)
MTGKTEQRLAELGITIPDAPPPAAAYVPWRRSGSLVLTSGQLPLVDGKLAATGLLGAEIDLEQGQELARICAINVLAQARSAAGGDLDRVRSVVKITVFVASAPGFTDQHLVANGASGLLAAVFGDNGQHARSAIGTASLPLNAPVEVEAIFEID